LKPLAFSEVATNGTKKIGLILSINLRRNNVLEPKHMLLTCRFKIIITLLHILMYAEKTAKDIPLPNKLSLTSSV